MPPVCQCRADPGLLDSANSTSLLRATAKPRLAVNIGGESSLCSASHFVEIVNFPKSNPQDPTGQDGYRLMGHFPLQTQREIIAQLPISGYGGQVRRFATAVTQVAEELVSKYSRMSCSSDDISTSPRSHTEKPLRGAKWTLRIFIRWFLKRKAPELATLPIQYMSQSPMTRAVYRPGDDTIFVGNTIIREIRTKRFISVLSTLHHEKTHRDSEMKHRTITEPLVKEAIALAANTIHNPSCAIDVFKTAAKHQFWREKDAEGSSEYVDHEDELYARITQLTFRAAHQDEQARTTVEDMETYETFLHSHIAGIANRFSPLVAGLILGYVEETVKADIPKGYLFLTNNMYSDTHYIQARSAMESYKTQRQVCQTPFFPTCNIPSNDDGRLVAEPSY